MMLNSLDWPAEGDTSPEGLQPRRRQVMPACKYYERTGSRAYGRRCLSRHFSLQVPSRGDKRAKKEDEPFGCHRAPDGVGHSGAKTTNAGCASRSSQDASLLSGGLGDVGIPASVAGDAGRVTAQYERAPCERPEASDDAGAQRMDVASDANVGQKDLRDTSPCEQRERVASSPQSTRVIDSAATFPGVVKRGTKALALASLVTSASGSVETFTCTVERGSRAWPKEDYEKKKVSHGGVWSAPLWLCR